MQTVAPLQRITAEPITAQAFAPFGQIFTRPAEAGRLDPQLTLENGRPDARPMLTLIRVSPKQFPLDVTLLERHPHSSQTFIPVHVHDIWSLLPPSSSTEHRIWRKCVPSLPPVTRVSTIASTLGIMVLPLSMRKVSSPCGCGTTGAMRIRNFFHCQRASSCWRHEWRTFDDEAS